MRSFLKKFIVVFSLVLSSRPASAWVEGEDYDVELTCKGLATLDATTVIVRTKAQRGSFGHPFLVGLDNGNVIWVRAFPGNTEVNIATMEASCNGKKIRIAYRYPMDQHYVIRDYRWTGSSFKFVRKKIALRYVGLDVTDASRVERERP